MSIIYDALKKTQQQLEAKKPQLLATAKRVPKWRLGLRIGLGAIVLSLVAASFFFPRPPVIKGLPIVADKKVPPLTLSGLFVSDREKLAIINDQVVHEGDHISQLRVEHIAFDDVELSMGMKRIHLKREV